MSALVVNLFAAPGAGKSSMCASIFSYLKWRDINCEMALEYAKEKVWEDTENILKNQIYIFGQQHRRIFRLVNKVDVVITDSPLLLSIIYDANNDSNFRTLVLNEFNKLNNINYFLKRKKKYNKSGRLQTEEEAKQLDNDIQKMLDELKIPYKITDGIPDNAPFIGDEIISTLNIIS